MLVRIAALVAVDAPPASYLLNLEAAGKVGVEEQIGGVLTGIAPIVGTARVAPADGKMVRARWGSRSSSVSSRRREKAGENSPLPGA